VVLPLLESDLLTIMEATANGTLAETEVKFSEKSACCVIVASEGYPTAYKKGFEITLPAAEEDKEIFVAGAKLGANGELLSDGGRVLGVTAVADTLENAIEKAYVHTKKVHMDNSFYRSDIGQRALKALK
jgi:phosphoribosylamine--glycine ligase